MWITVPADAPQKGQANKGDGEEPAPAGLFGVAVFALIWMSLSSAGFF